MAVKVKQYRGAWWVLIDHKGKRKAKRIGASKRAEEQIEARINLGQFGILEENERRPFRAYYKEWLDSYAKTPTKAATYANYETAYRVHLLPFFGDTDIRDITRAQVKRFLYEKLKEGRQRPRAGQDKGGLSRSSVKAILAPLSEMFNHAIEDGHL